jgi:hypothetical protein
VSLVGMVGGFLWLVAGLEIVLQCPTFSALPNGQTSPCGAVGRIHERDYKELCLVEEPWV